MDGHPDSAREGRAELPRPRGHAEGGEVPIEPVRERAHEPICSVEDGVAEADGRLHGPGAVGEEDDGGGEHEAPDNATESLG